MSAVPNNTTFLFSDICNAVFGNYTAGQTLLGCFASSVSAKFDPAYSGSKDRMLCFQNYGAVKRDILIWASLTVSNGLVVVNASTAVTSDLTVMVNVVDSTGVSLGNFAFILSIGRTISAAFRVLNAYTATVYSITPSTDNSNNYIIGLPA